RFPSMDTSKIGEYLKEPLEKILQGVGGNLPLILEALAIILIGLLVAFLLRFLTFRLISGLQKTLRKKMKVSAETIRKVDSSGARVASRIVFWGVLLFFLAASLHVLDRPIISKGINTLAGYFPNLLAAALIIFVGFVAGNILGATVHKIFASSKVGHGDFFGKVTKILILLTVFLVAIEQLGINIDLLIIILGILTGMVAGGTALAFALGAQSTVRNILATYYLGKFYRVGQRVQIGEVKGKILQLESTCLVLETSTGTATIPAAWFLEKPVHMLQNE
ncbi:MAG: mechanosensitive ion channel, partial [bacterium]|nr:mechanosensitive ion channel [bacterium]